MHRFAARLLFVAASFIPATACAGHGAGEMGHVATARAPVAATATAATEVPGPSSGLSSGQAPVPAPDPVALAAAIDRIGAQVRRCYRSPIRIRAARQIVTVLRVRFAADGRVSGLPDVVRQTGITPDGAPFADAMANAAREAVIRCTPLAAPPELYNNGWDELLLTFSPRGAA